GQRRQVGFDDFAGEQLVADGKKGGCLDQALHVAYSGSSSRTTGWPLASMASSSSTRFSAASSWACEVRDRRVPSSNSASDCSSERSPLSSRSTIAVRRLSASSKPRASASALAGAALSAA